MIHGYYINKSEWYLQDFDNCCAYWTTNPKAKLVFTTKLEAELVAEGIQLLTRRYCTVSAIMSTQSMQCS